jgi:hypothetical protein
MPAKPSFLTAAEAAQIDLRAARPSWGELRLQVVESPDDPWFDVAYRMFDEEFGPTAEIERREVLARRLKNGVLKPTGDCTILYHFVLLLHGNECVAVRDHTAIYLAGASEVVVRLSHSYVVPAWRGQGLSRILHVLPDRTGRACAAAAGRPDATVRFVAEMLPWDPTDQASLVKSLVLERSGYMKIDPRLGYRQPDFRPAAEVDASGELRLIKLDFMVQRLPHEEKRSLHRSELCHYVRCVGHEYALDCREDLMRPYTDWIRAIETSGVERYPLFRPTENVP